MAIAGGRGIRIGAEELDLLVEIGANDVLQAAAAEELRIECQRRNETRRSIAGENTGSAGTGRPMEASAPRSLPSIGMTPSSDAREALQRAQRMSALPSVSSTRSTSRT